jgi:hypothetical protein
MSPQLSVALRVMGPALDVDSIESTLGFGATSAWRKGERVSGSQVQRKTDGWEFRIPFRAGYAIGETVIAIQSAIGNRNGDLRRTCEERGYRIEIVCVVEMYDETAGLALSADVVAWLAHLGASLTIDTYVSESSR